MGENTEIFLVRHGETQWNTQKRLQGNKNSPLTEKGMAQARETQVMADRFAVDQAFVSPLKRARDTLDIILEKREIPVHVKEELREMNLGPWEGRTRNETKLSHPDEYRAFWKAPDSFNLEGAETYNQLQTRMVNGLESIFIEEKNRTSLVVSHWIAIKTVLAHYMSVPLSGLPGIANPENGSLLRLSRQGRDTFVHQLINSAWHPFLRPF